MSRCDVTPFAPYKMLSNISYHPARPSLRRCAISHGNLTPLYKNSFNSFKGVKQTSKGRQRTQNPAQKPAIGHPMNSKRINQMITQIAFMISWYFLSVVLLDFILVCQKSQIIYRIVVCSTEVYIFAIDHIRQIYPIQKRNEKKKRYRAKILVALVSLQHYSILNK